MKTLDYDTQGERAAFRVTKDIPVGTWVRTAWDSPDLMDGILVENEKDSESYVDVFFPSGLQRISRTQIIGTGNMVEAKNTGL